MAFIVFLGGCFSRILAAKEKEVNMAADFYPCVPSAVRIGCAFLLYVFVRGQRSAHWFKNAALSAMDKRLYLVRFGLVLL